MAGFDPAAATAAYLAQVPAGLRLAAHGHASEAHWSGVAGGGLAILICWLILKTGVLGKLRRWIERGQPRPWLATLACAAAFLTLFALLITPWDALIAWRQSLAPGALEFDPVDFAVDAFRAELAPLTAIALLLSVIYALVRRAPRRWWLWSGGVAATLIVASVWLPYALASGPANLPPVPAGPTRDGLIRLAHDTGLPVREVYLTPDPVPDADVTGALLGARVVISRGMLAQASPAEVRAGVGHLAGHFHNGDQLSMAILLSLLFLGGLFAAHTLFWPAARVLGAAGLEGPADPAGLPVFAAIGFVWLGAAGIGFNNFDRLVNVRADQYSLDHAREPDGLAQSLVRDWRGDDVDPLPADEVLFYDHPSLKSRVLHAMTWKAARRANPS